jgi:WD40 repeat protein
VNDPSHERAIDRICTDFEQAWIAGNRPRIEDYLTDAVEQDRLLQELIAIEMFHRHRLGETPSLDEYRERFPQAQPEWFADSPVSQSETLVLVGASTEVAPPTRGPYFGDYELLAEISVGGMGVVWRARQVSLNRVVALKMIRSGEFATPEAVERFHTEAEAAASLDHPHIVPIHEVGEHNHQHYFSMKLIEGGSLKDRLAEVALMPDLDKAEIRSRQKAIARLMVTVARAVHHAHQRGILHRDLKPANILLDEAGQPHVTDFGLAKRIEGDACQTQPGQILGTPSYMAPEQARGEMIITTQADVYGLGAILYELLTSRPPFRGATVMETIQQVIHDEPIRPRAIVRHADRDLETICLKCLEKDPARRYSSAEAVAEELERYLVGEPIRARPVGNLERAAKWVKRNPVVAALATAVLLVLVVGVAVSASFAYLAGVEAMAARKAEKNAEDRADEEAKAKQLARNETRRANKERAIAEEQLRRAEWLGYVGKLSLAQSVFAEGNTPLALHYLEDCQWSLRGWEHRHLWTRFQSKQKTLEHDAQVFSVAISPDGKRIVTGSGNVVKVWNAETGQGLSTLKGHTDSVTSVCFSPNGKRILSGSKDNTLRVWNADNDQLVLAVKGHTNGINCARYSFDGNRIVSGSGGTDPQGRWLAGEVKVWDAEDGEQLLSIQKAWGSATSVTFSPDGKQIVVGYAEGGPSATVWDAETGQEIRSLVGGTDGVYSVAYSPDGKHILTGGGDSDPSDELQFGEASLWDAEMGTKLVTFKGHVGVVNNVAFSPDGQRIVTVSEDKTVRLWNAETGQESLTLTGHNDIVLSAAFSPDGTQLVTGSLDKTARVWQAAKAQAPHPLKGFQNSINNVCFSPDGKRILVGVYVHSGKVFDADKGRELCSLEGQSGSRGVNVCFSPDGKRILGTGDDGELGLWDAETGEKLIAFDKLHRQRFVTCLAFSPDGKRILTGSDDTTAKVWDAKKGTEILELKGHTGSVRSVSFSPDGKRILTGSWDNTAKVWDAEKGTAVLTLKGAGGPVSWSPDGKRIVTGSGNVVKVWDSETGETILSLGGHTRPVTGVAFSPDGKWIVTGSWDKTAKIWNAATGREVRTLGHTAGVTSVAYSPDNRRIVTGSEEPAVKVWDAMSPE